MFLHDIGFDKFDIACEDTLIAPAHWDDEPFELIVSNPPYSIKWAGDDNPLLINDPRFAPAGVLAPKSKADLAFIMHSLSWLASNGTAAIVCFPGIMYRGGAEQKIRKYLIDNNFVAYSATDAANVRRFQQKLESLGVNATVRRRLGSEISAACGQLRRDEMNGKV